MPIYFHNEDREHFLPDLSITINWLEKTIQLEKGTLDELNYIFCSDDYLLNINKTYLQHDYYTDVITFDNSVDSSAITGDIFISIDRVSDNSETHHISKEQELSRIMVHGLLHLLGYGDKTEEDKKEMTQKEDTYLSLLEI